MCLDNNAYMACKQVIHNFHLTQSHWCHEDRSQLMENIVCQLLGLCCTNSVWVRFNRVKHDRRKVITIFKELHTNSLNPMKRNPLLQSNDFMYMPCKTNCSSNA